MFMVCVCVWVCEHIQWVANTNSRLSSETHVQIEMTFCFISNTFDIASELYQRKR